MTETPRPDNDPDSQKPASDAPPTNDATGPSQFEQQAQQRSPGFFAELFAFLKFNQKWWLAPIIVILLVMGLLIAVGGTAIAPLIYALW